MTTPLSLEMIATVRRVESSFIENKLDLISQEHGAGRLTLLQVQEVLSQYLKGRGKITRAPNEYPDSLKAVVVDDATIPTWHVDYDIWVDHKQSDLTVSLELYLENGVMKAVVQDLHVM